MQRIVFASDELSAGLDDGARFALWRDVFTSAYCPLDLYRADDRPFSLCFEFTQLGEVGLGMLEGRSRAFHDRHGMSPRSRMTILSLE